MSKLPRPVLEDKAQLRPLFSLLQDLPSFRSLVDEVRKRRGVTTVSGLPGGGAAFVLAALALETDRPLVWITADSHGASQRAADLAVWLGHQTVGLLEAQEVLPYDLLAASGEASTARLQALGRAALGQLKILVVPAAALPARVPQPQLLQEASFPLAVGDGVDLTELLHDLTAAGYQRVEQVAAPGQAAVRGGIIDLFPMVGTVPYRLELFGDQIESIRLLDLASQRSHGDAAEILITPATQLLLPPPARQKLLTQLENQLAEIEKRQDLTYNRKTRLLERVGEHRRRFQEGLAFPGMERYFSLAYPEARSAVALMGSHGLVVQEEPQRIAQTLSQRHQQHSEQYSRLLELGEVVPAEAAAYLTADELAADLAANQNVHLSEWGSRGTGAARGGTLVSFRGRTVPSFRGQWRLFLEELAAWHGARRRVVLAVGDETSGRHLAASLDEAQIRAVPPDQGQALPPAPATTAVVTAELNTGFQLDDVGLVVLSAAEVTGRRSRREIRRRAAPGAVIEHHDDLNEGDYVVHVYQGIGRYLGMQTMTVQGAQGDYLVLEYAAGDRLYVPTDQIDLVQKYAGAEGRQPRLSKMGGAEWSRTKERVRASVREMAVELTALYAARQAVKGHAFAPDQPWQREFEAAFPYTETEDQLKAIAEIKKDMEQPQPADRLLCGDVGFGKTEVALRAAFKAVQESKQVAILVPTTILAQQHYETARERMAGFPVNFGLLSRFRTARQQQETIDGLRQGTVDIVVGTHRLLQSDVGFKDLGLLIVDEEHRFGVAHKERIKQLKQNVDVLTLTATPIPRTLQMALTGLRDMSSLNTPPADRRPVQTYVTEYSDALVQDAILRELNRGGQVFYVHNRVQSIGAVQARLAKLVPQARIAVGHGQLEEEQLEQVMLDFVAGHYDVLLSTTIIESGLDIANANTLIVENAHQMGLAQLHQLRGRVGRSHRMAYAYFTYQPGRLLTEIAQKRLQAIRDFTELGSGLKLAMRDLEIRGAGNILGAEQHGFMLSVGFELYTQLLAEAVQDVKGELQEQRLRPTVDLRWDAYLPSDYISDSRRKIEFYKRIEQADSRQQLLALREEMEDRFGDLPPPARNLITVAEIRRRAAAAGVLGITRETGSLKVELAPLPPETMKQLPAVVKHRRTTVSGTAHRPIITLRLVDNSRRALLQALGRLLNQLAELH